MLVGLEAWAELEAWAGLAEPAVVSGSITRRIAAVLRMETGLRQTGLAGRLAETRWPIVKQVRETRSGARAVMWAPTAEALAELEGSAEPAGAEALAELAGLAEPAIAEVQAERTASAAAISRAAGAETGTPSEEGTAVSMDRVRAPAATVAPPAWDLVAAAEHAAVAAAGDAGNASKGIQEH